MSGHTVEALLYKLANDPAAADAFAADREALLDRYPLSPEERRHIGEWDLHAILAGGVSPMLLMFGYTAVHGGPQSRDEYIRILKAPPTAVAAAA